MGEQNYNGNVLGPKLRDAESCIAKLEARIEQLEAEKESLVLMLESASQATADLPSTLSRLPRDENDEVVVPGGGDTVEHPEHGRSSNIQWYVTKEWVAFYGVAYIPVAECRLVKGADDE